MNILLVDDEPLSLDNLLYTVSLVCPDSHTVCFLKASKALDYLMRNPVDIAFLDIDMRGISGIELARVLREHNPRVNILFCTAFSQYSLDAWDLDCSGYLLKPITENKVRHALETLRFPVEPSKRVRFQCFGNFEVFCDGAPVVFMYQRTKEFLAYLVDRNGVLCSMKELSAVLFEDDAHRSYLYSLRKDLLGTLQALQVSDILVHSKGSIGIRKEQVLCDYYNY